MAFGWRIGAFAAVVATSLTGCVQTSKVNDAVTPAALAQTKKAVALMRIGAASPNCLHVAVLLGMREGDGYRRGQVIKVANVRSLAEEPVAEVELDPGEHHVIGYACANAKGSSTVMDKADHETYRTSYAYFALKPGEVVNIGYLHFGASHIGRSAFGRPLRIDVKVTDWPLREIEQFKAKRPGLFAQMTTRLMLVTGPATLSEDDCARMKALHATGKVQTLPASCTGMAGPARTAKVK